LAAELNEPSAENSFGICLERGIGVHSNLELAVRYYQRAAAQGHPDGANNLGFCFEHGRGIKQDIEAAAEFSKFARDHGHPDGDLNYRRCLRILGHWDVPDRSSQIADSRPSDDNLSRLFVECLKDPDTNPELVFSIQRLLSISSGPKKTPEWVDNKMTSWLSSNVRLMEEFDGSLIVVKSPKTQSAVERETEILKKMNHPLIMKYSSPLAIEFVPNGSLANHLPGHQNTDLCPWRKPTRIAKIIVGIVLAMRYIHSQNVIHGDLTPNNILLDWKWNIRIADFGRNISSDCAQVWPSADFHYLAPECYEHEITPESDVFSFGLILYELIVGKSAISATLNPYQIAGMMILKDWMPDIPNFVLPQTKDLIMDCLLKDNWDRPSFSDIFDRIKEMRFKLMPRVNSSKLVKCVKEIEAWEATNLT
jgi:hypothetical protein